MRTIRTHSFGQEPWNAIRVVILGPAPGALWSARHLHGDVTANTTGICGSEWLRRCEWFLDKKEMSSETLERLLRFLTKSRAIHFKRQRNDANKHCRSQKLKTINASIGYWLSYVWEIRLPISEDNQAIAMRVSRKHLRLKHLDTYDQSQTFLIRPNKWGIFLFKGPKMFQINLLTWIIMLYTHLLIIG